MDKEILDFSVICRICLEKGGVFSIFDNDDNMLLADKIMLCSAIQIREHDEFPTTICRVCNSMLGIALDFKNKCELSDHTLRKYVATKAEIDEIEDDVESKDFEYHNVEYANGIDYEPVIDHCSDIEDEDIKPKIEAEDEDDVPLLKIQLIANSGNNRTETKERRKKKGKKKISEKVLLKTKNPSNIASSLLEGVFKWDGCNWRHMKKKKSENIIKKNGNCNSNELPDVGLRSKILRDKEKELKKALRLKLKLAKQKDCTPSLCDHCGHQFNSKWRLRDHIRLKHVARTLILKCSFPGCSKMFNSNYYRNRHEKRIHSERKDFVCTECGRQFAFKNELITHTKKHDPIKYPKKLKKCKFCPQTYRTQKSTDIHERSAHTGERPAVCKICDSAFFHEDYLKEHTRLHTGETPFKCPICGRGYAQRCNMKSHLRIHKVSELDEKTKLKMKPNYLKLLRD